MALWEGITEAFGESLVPNLLVGAAAVVLAPIMVPAVMAGLRPVVKTAIKGGIYVFDKAQDIVAEAGEQLSDLVAESRAEMAASAAARDREAI
jgi:hypothetical protein